MKKEKLTAEHIRQDLILQIRLYTPVSANLVFLFPAVVAGIAIFVLEFSLSGTELNLPLVVGMAAVVAVCIGIVLFADIRRRLRNRKREKELASSIDQGFYRISVHVLERVEKRTAYHPRRRSGMCEVTVYSFRSGVSWTDWRQQPHYQWSWEYRLTPQGLENISVAGNHFYIVSMRDHPEISYIYPCKLFESDEYPEFFSE